MIDDTATTKEVVISLLELLERLRAMGWLGGRAVGRSVKTENRLIVTLGAGKVAFWPQYQLVKILERSFDVFCLRREVKVSKF